MKIFSKLTFLALAQLAFSPAHAGGVIRQLMNLATTQPYSVANFIKMYDLIQSSKDKGYTTGTIYSAANTPVQNNYHISIDTIINMTPAQITALTNMNTMINGSPAVAATARTAAVPAVPAVWNPALAAPAGAADPGKTGGFTTVGDGENFLQALTTFGNMQLYSVVFPEGQFYLQRAQEQKNAAERGAGVATGTSITQAAFLRDAITQLLPADSNPMRRNNLITTLGATNDASLSRIYTNLLNDIISNLTQGRAYLNNLRKTYRAPGGFAPDPLPAYVAGTRNENVENPNMTMQQFMDQVFANYLRYIFYTPAIGISIPELFPHEFVNAHIIRDIPDIQRLNPDSITNFQDTASTAFAYATQMQRLLYQLDQAIINKIPGFVLPATNLLAKLNAVFIELNRQAGAGLPAAEAQVLITNHNNFVTEINKQVAALLPFYNSGQAAIDGRIDAILRGRFVAGRAIEADVYLNPDFVLAFGSQGLKSATPAPQFGDNYLGDVAGFRDEVRTKVANGLAALLTGQINGCIQSAQVLRRLSHNARIGTFAVTGNGIPFNPAAATAANMGANLSITVQDLPVGAAPVPPAPPVPPVPGPVPPVPGPAGDPLQVAFHNRQVRALMPQITQLVQFFNMATPDATLTALQVIGAGPMPVDATGQTAPLFVTAFGPQGLATVIGTNQAITQKVAGLGNIKALLKSKAIACLRLIVFPNMNNLMMQAATLRATNPLPTVINTFQITSIPSRSPAGTPAGPLAINPVPADGGAIGSNLNIAIIPAP